jgi:hypothetical protein
MLDSRNAPGAIRLLFEAVARHPHAALPVDDFDRLHRLALAATS